MVPVIYRVDMSDPATFFVAQGFPILNKDVLYVSNAPLADMQKFVNVVSAMVFSIVGIGQAVN
jgi:polysaccharide export outer membrane protein